MYGHYVQHFVQKLGMSELDKHLLFQTSLGVLKEQNSQKER